MKKTNISAKTPAGRIKLAQRAKSKSPWNRQPNCSSKRAQRIYDEFQRSPKEEAVKP